MPNPSSSNENEAITYGDVILDGEILFHNFYYAAKTIEQMGIL